jgi:serine phosphatase RsbU (regulator of sigma subunit)/tetratricopeptide (TPR) repeat protein
MKLFYSIVLFLISGLVCSGQSYVDSIEIELKTAVSNEERISLIERYLYDLTYHNPDTALYYANYGIELAKKEGDFRSEVVFISALGDCHMRLSNYALSLTHLFEAVQLNEKLNDSAIYRYLYNNIGNVYRYSNQLEEAKDYYARALNVSRLTHDSSGVAFGFNNLGIIYMMNSEYPMGMSLWGNSLTMKLAIGDSIGAATTMSNMAMYYRDIGETEKALDYFIRSVEIKKNYNDFGGISIAYDNLGELYSKLEDHKSAIYYYKMALDQAELSKSKRLVSVAYYNLSQGYKFKGDYEEALANFEIYKKMEDSIMSQKTLHDLSIAESKFENDKKALVIEKMSIKEEVQTAKIAHQDEEAKRQNLIKWIFGFGALVMLLFGLVMLRNYKRKKSDHKLIVAQKVEVEEQHKEITDSIDYAERIQFSFLATKKMLDENLGEHFVFFKPKDVVSGDFYWADKLSNGNFAVVNADSTGHGVPGAIMSILNISSIESAIEQGLTNPAEIFNESRKRIIERLKKDGSVEGGKDGMDASIVCFNADKTKMTYTAAQNPIWVIRDGKLTEIKPEKMPIGKHHNDAVPFVGGECDLQKGDVIYTLTDGFQDQFGGPKGKKFMVKKMRGYILSISNLSMQEQYQKLDEVFSNWKGEIEQVDDVCIIGVKI